MAIIIADIHGDIEVARAFQAYKSDVEHVILGDLVDARKNGITLEDELACLDLLFSSDSVLLWGNHDLAYAPQQPWRSFTPHCLSYDDIIYYAGKSEFLKQRNEENDNLFVRDILEERYLPHLDRMKAAYVADGWLCTHAGVSPGVAAIIPAEVISAGTQKIADWLDEEFKREMRVPMPSMSNQVLQRYGYGPLFYVPYCRGGGALFGGIFWFDYIGELVDPSPLVGRQLIGHTPVPYPDTGKTWINLDTFEEGIWIMDTQENLLVDISSGESMQVSAK